MYPEPHEGAYIGPLDHHGPWFAFGLPFADKYEAIYQEYLTMFFAAGHVNTDECTKMIDDAKQDFFKELKEWKT